MPTTAYTYSTRYPISIVMAITMHLVWAVGLLIDNAAVNATGLHALHTIFQQHDITTAAVILAVVAAAVTGLFVRGTQAKVLLLIPQQILLWFSVAGVSYAMLIGRFADGVQRSHLFLVVDQIPVILVALGHTAALLLSVRGTERHGERDWRINAPFRA